MGEFFQPKLVIKYFPKILSYLPLTLGILIASLSIGIIIAFAVAIVRIYKIKILNQIAVVYVSFIRGTPLIIQLYLVFYGLPAVLQLVNIDIVHASPIFFVIATYALSVGAFLSEVLRGAVNSVDKGQTEAAYSVGLTTVDTFFRIVLPQALLVAFPNFTNLLVGYLKDTSLAFTLGVVDMMGIATVIGNYLHHYLEVYVDLAIIYFIICLAINKGFGYLEVKIKSRERTIVGE